MVQYLGQRNKKTESSEEEEQEVEEEEEDQEEEVIEKRYAQNYSDLLPDDVLLNIFSYLTASDIVKASRVCMKWFRVSRDDHLWRRKFLTDFGRSGDCEIIAQQYKIETGFWLREYKRLSDECPSVEFQTLRGHTDHILHATFSHLGTMLATCSKDGTLKVWRLCASTSHAKTDHGCQSDLWLLAHDKDLRTLLYWRFTLCSRFNCDSTLLLVSGIRANGNALGEIAIFEFAKCKNANSSIEEVELKFRCRAINEPFDVYGCWYDGESILNGQSRWFNRTSTMSDVYFLCAASEQTTSTRLFQFYNKEGGVVRTLLVSSYSGTPDHNEKTLEEQGENSLSPEMDSKILIFTTGRRMDTPHQIGLKTVKRERIVGPLDAATARKSEPAVATNPKSAACKRPIVIKEEKTNEKSSSDVSVKPDKCTDAEKKGAPFSEDTNETDSKSADETRDKTEAKNDMNKHPDEEQKAEVQKPVDEPEDAGATANASSPANAASALPPVITDSSEDEDSEEEDQQVQIRVHTFDRIDHVIELGGRIVGVSLSGDQRYIFVNVRPFIDPAGVLEREARIAGMEEDEDESPPPAVETHIEVRVIDLQTCALIDYGHESHFRSSNATVGGDASAVIPSEFFIDLHASERYILSGSDGARAYLWDRKHQCLIRTLQHDHCNVVHAVAFHPLDQNVCVSASDGCTIKVWHSKAYARALSQK